MAWDAESSCPSSARSIGRKRALEMLFTGEMIDAATALDWGLVNRVVPDDQLESEGMIGDVDAAHDETE